jgi:hypothetical protein
VPAKLSPWIDPQLPRRPTLSVSKDSILSQTDRWSFNFVPKKTSYSNTSSDPSVYPSSADSTISVPLQISPPKPVFLEAVERAAGVQLLPPGYRTTTVDNKDSFIKSQTSVLHGPPGLEVTPSRNNKASELPGKESASSPTVESEPIASECLSVIDSSARSKLVIVKRVFLVSLPDELKVKEGERLRLLREFKDGWALCQRTSKRNPEKGAVPRCCLTELTVNTANARAGRRVGVKTESREKG